MITGQNMTLADAFGEGLKVTGLGMGIVFAVLIILMIVLCLFKVIFYRPAQGTAEQEAETAPAAPAAVPAEPEEDDELIAVLAAAAAASMNTSTYNLRIKSYRRVDNHVPVWNKAGVNQTIENRTF